MIEDASNDEIGRLVAPALSIRLQTTLIALIVLVIAIRLLNANPADFGIHTILGFAAVADLIVYFITLYSLSRALDPKLSIAIIVIVLQLIPIIGVPVAISMILKGKKLGIRKMPEIPSASGNPSDA